MIVPTHWQSQPSLYHSVEADHTASKSSGSKDCPWPTLIDYLISNVLCCRCSIVRQLMRPAALVLMLPFNGFVCPWLISRPIVTPAIWVSMCACLGHLGDRFCSFFLMFWMRGVVFRSALHKTIYVLESINACRQ